VVRRGHDRERDRAPARHSRAGTGDAARDANRHGMRLALMLFDIDDFKALNRAPVQAKTTGRNRFVAS
jgi:hypothetical protein